MKKVLKIAAIALLAVLAVVLLYVRYVFGTYSRIEDNQALSVTQGSGGVQTAEADTEYKVLCWNIGFGAPRCGHQALTSSASRNSTRRAAA